MADKQAPFESPALPPLQEATAPADSDRQKEPDLDADQIQGNIFPGFSKDFQTLLFLRIANPAGFAGWLGSLIPRIATMDRVVTFNRLFKAIRHAQQGETA